MDTPFTTNVAPVGTVATPPTPLGAFPATPGERLHRQQRIKDQAVAGPEYGCSFARNVPRQAQTRTEIGAIGFVERADLMAHLLQSNAGIEAAQQVVLLLTSVWCTRSAVRD